MKVNQKFGEKMIGDTQQYDELSRLYSSFGDKELLSLARDMDDLTETAQQVLKSELGRRGLEAAATAALPAEPLHDDLADSPLQAFAAMAPDECIFEFADIEEANAARKALADADIESVIANRQFGSMDPIRLVVAPEDALTAGLIFAQPLQQDSDNLVDEDPVFIEPVCPQCGAVDPLLESVEPTNQWRCEACEHVWNDADIALNG